MTNNFIRNAKSFSTVSNAIKPTLTIEQMKTEVNKPLLSNQKPPIVDAVVDDDGQFFFQRRLEAQTLKQTQYTTTQCDFTSQAGSVMPTP